MSEGKVPEGHYVTCPFQGSTKMNDRQDSPHYRKEIHRIKGLTPADNAQSIDSEIIAVLKLLHLVPGPV